MNPLFRLIAVTLLLSSVGCSTVVVDRATGAAVTGKAYATTLKNVNDLALERSLDFGANLLAANPAFDGKRDATVLNQVTEAHQQRLRTVSESSAYLDTLSVYFSGLEALAKGDPSEATANALGGVVDALKNEPFNVQLSDERRKALTGLAGFVSKQVHAATLEKVLQRDADRVAQAIAVSDEMLNTVAGWITRQETLEAKKTFAESVEKPFASGASLGSDWKNAWKSYVRGPAVNEVLTDAKKASGDLGRAWTNLLSGQYTFDEVLASLKNVQAGIDAIAALVKSK